MGMDSLLPVPVFRGYSDSQMTHSALKTSRFQVRKEQINFFGEGCDLNFFCNSFRNFQPNNP